MNKLLALGVVAALVMAALALVQSPVATTLGGTTNFDAITLDDGDLTISDGNFVWDAPSSGTSTLATVGCIQAYATSSATTIKLVYNTVASSTGNGFVLWAYGTCP